MLLSAMPGTRSKMFWTVSFLRRLCHSHQVFRFFQLFFIFVEQLVVEFHLQFVRLEGSFVGLEALGTRAVSRTTPCHIKGTS